MHQTQNTQIALFSIIVTAPLKAFQLLKTQNFSLVNWSIKANRRKTTGTGRMRHLKELHRRFKNGFREGTQAKSQKRKGGVAPASSGTSQ